MIEFNNVSKVYDNGARALEDISFSVDSGEFIFCIGESGAGKSTLIRLLTCEERPTSGSVTLGNAELGRLRKRRVPRLRQKIGMIFQDFRLIESKTVFENVAFAMEIVGASKAEIKKRVPMVLSVVGLRDKASDYPSELSGGEAQRVGVARAMINNPSLIVADEPTGNLDPANGEAILALLEEINRAGTTVICCTHDVGMVNLMRKRVIELKNGHLIRDEVEGTYDDTCQIGAGDLNFERSDEDLAELDEALLENIKFEEEERQASLARREKHSRSIRLQVNEDSRKRKNRMSLAERIARMRVQAERISREDNRSESFEALEKQVCQESEAGHE